MGKITLTLNYNRLDGYNEGDFEKFLKAKIEEEPNELKGQFEYNIEFNNQGCNIDVESLTLNEKILNFYIVGNINTIEYEYESISNVSFRVKEKDEIL